MKPRWDTYEISESARFPDLVGRRVVDVARERGIGPLDVMCELAVAEDLDTRFRAYIANDDVDAVGGLLTAEHVVLGLSDAGAHVDQLCDAPLPTDLLGTWVRDRGVLTVERGRPQARGRAGRHVRLRPARLPARGRVGRRHRASIPTRWAPDRRARVRDFPADAERLTAEEPTGMRHVLVNGTPIRLDGEQLDLTGRRPGVRPALG